MHTGGLENGGNGGFFAVVVLPEVRPPKPAEHLCIMHTMRVEKKENNKQKVQSPGPPICLGPHSSCHPAAPEPRRAAALCLALHEHHPSPHVLVLVHPPAHQMVCQPTNRQHSATVCCATPPPTVARPPGKLAFLVFATPCCCSGTTANPKGVEMTRPSFLAVWALTIKGATSHPF